MRELANFLYVDGKDLLTVLLLADLAVAAVDRRFMTLQALKDPC